MKKLIAPSYAARRHLTTKGASRIRLALITTALALTLAPASHAYAPGCASRGCEVRVKAKVLKKQRVAEMKRYRRSPMPRCTWWGESGPGRPEWGWARYRAKNPVSTAGGKFQIIDSTWYAMGGRRFAVRHPAAAAPPVEQERIARRVLRAQGLGAWVLC